MGKIEKKILKEFNSTRNTGKYLCKAPFVSMKISIDGRVSPCCYNKEKDDLYPEKSLKEIWQGDVFNAYRKNIKKNILPSGCRVCENAILNKEFHSAKIHQYDSFKVKRNKPRMIELAMDNTCNLECVMCTGRHSSSIRKNVEKLPLQKSVFTDGFLDEIRNFIPDLEQFVFAGGEPFLIKSYFSIWEDIIRINPKCEIALVTNGTVLNDKIKDVLSRGNFRINLSFDAVEKDIYEKIRVGANFENVKANIDYFGQYMRRRGGHLHIPVCPLKINRYNIPDIVRFCNDNKFSLNFVHVSGAYHSALWGLSSSELEQLKVYYLSQSFMANDELEMNNVLEFNDLIVRLDKWIENACLKEKFQDVFDLKDDKVDELKQALYERINLVLKKNFKHRKNAIYNFDFFDSNFKTLMNSLPEFFNSNHFYVQLSQLSESVIIEEILNMPIDVMIEKSNELFYFGHNLSSRISLK